MSVSWGRQLGTVIGGTLAGPCGAIIGGLGGSFLSQKVTMDDPIRDAIGGVIGEGAGALLGRLTPGEQKRVNHDLQAAFRDAFCEALYDIGGEACFASQWGGGGRDVPLEVVFSRSAGKRLWDTNDLFAGQVCDYLRGMVQAVSDERLLPFEPPEPAANVEHYLNCSTPQALSDEFFKDVLQSYLSRTRALFIEVRSFEPHLRRYLFNRTLVHLKEHLKERTKAWRAFNRMVLEELRLTVRRLDTNQEQVRVKLEKLELHLDDLIKNQVPALSDNLSKLLALTGRIEKQVDEGFEDVISRVNDFHNDIIARLYELQQGIEGLPELVAFIVKGELSALSKSIPAGLFDPPSTISSFVPRDAEREHLVTLLLANESLSGVYALSGAGGFGKTTLAQAVCDDDRVKTAFADGILWVTLGREPEPLELLSALAKSLNPNAVTYSDADLAASQFRALLADKDVLIVLDDVWHESHVIPFVSDNASFLITTRLQDVSDWQLGTEIGQVLLGSMSTQQARSMLTNSLKGSQAFGALNFPDLIEQLDKLNKIKRAEKLNCSDLIELYLEIPTIKKASSVELCILIEQLDALAQMLGRWPLLLSLIGAQLRDYVTRRHHKLSVAMVNIQKRLAKRGFGAFDRTNKEQRHRAISISFELSLQQLDASCSESGLEPSSWRQRYLELAFFSKDVDMPFEIIFQLWEKTAGFDEYDSEDALFAMQALSLFTRLDPDTQTVRLHNVMHALMTAKAKEPSIPHEQLLGELRALCFSFEWLQSKFFSLSIKAWLANFEWLPKDESLKRVGQALRHAAHILADDGGYLAGQLVARLMAEEDEAIKQLIREANQALGVPCLRPLRASLEEKDKYQRTFADHISGVKQVAIWRDFGVSASSDKRLKVWDIPIGHNMPNGQELYTLRGHEARVSAVAVTEGKVISADWAGMLALWDPSSGELLRKWQAHEGHINDVVIQNGDLISVSEDKTIKKWDLASGALRSSWQIHDDGVLAVAVNSLVGITSDWDERLLLWDAESGQLLASLEGHEELVSSVAMNDRVAISASHDGTLKVWDLEQAICIRTLRGHRKSVNAVASQGELAVSVSADKTLKVWHLERGTCLTTFHLDEKLNACAIGEGGVVMAGGESGRVHLLRLVVG